LNQRKPDSTPYLHFAQARAWPGHLTARPQLLLQRLHKGVYQDKPSESPFAHAHRGEAIRVYVRSMRDEVFAFRRASAPRAHSHRWVAVKRFHRSNISIFDIVLYFPQRLS